jgi:hypothetical protein
MTVAITGKNTPATVNFLPSADTAPLEHKTKAAASSDAAARKFPLGSYS